MGIVLSVQWNAPLSRFPPTHPPQSRDHRCPKTLFNLFTKAKHPERVHAGVIQQNNDGDVDCLFAYCNMIKEERGLTPLVPVLPTKSRYVRIDLGGWVGELEKVVRMNE